MDFNLDFLKRFSQLGDQFQNIGRGRQQVDPLVQAKINEQAQQGRTGLFGRLGDPTTVGLLAAAAGIAQGEGIANSIQSGTNLFENLNTKEEQKRRRAAISKLGEKYKDDPRMMELAKADPDMFANLVFQLEADKRKYRAPKAPTTLQQRQQLAAALGFAPDSAEYRRILETGSAAARSITTAKDADGFLRNVATGERVFPDATGKTDKPVLSNVGGTLYNVTDPSNPTVVVAAKDDPKTAKIGDKLYDITDINNPTVIVDETPAQKPVLSNVGGTLYNVTDPTNPTVVVAAKDDPKTANIGGTLYDITDINNPKVVVAGKADPVNPSVKNFLATGPMTINGKTYKKGDVFAINTNDATAVGDALEAGAIVAPTRTEQTVTNTSATDIANTINSLKSETPANELGIDVGTAAGGDIGGVGTDIMNSVASLFGTSFDPSREEAKATVEAANNSIREPLVKALSRSGSVYTQKQIEKLLPSSGDGNEAFIQKAEALIPTLENELRLQATLMNTSSDAAERTAAENSAKALVSYIESMQNAISVYRKRKQSGSSVQSQADQILNGG